MPLTDAEFERAFAEWQEFGPQRAIPIERRWAPMFPHATPADFADARQHCEEIEGAAYTLADQVWAKKLDATAAFQQFSRQFPKLTKAALDRAWSQGMYFASK